MTAGEGQLVIFSGGTAFNEVAGELRKYTAKVSYVIPVSDDGGSTAEIIRVLGGPAVGDIRSRILRLSAENTEEEQAVKNLLGHRLPSDCEEEAKLEWLAIADGTHSLWQGISMPYKQIIRRFLTYFTSCVLKEDRLFRFSNGSTGNFFFAGARLFFASIESAIFLYSRVSGVPGESQVLPVIVESESRINLACELTDGSRIFGQNAISHPSSASTYSRNVVHKDCAEQLPSRIKRVFYTSMGNEVSHTVNPTVVKDLQVASAIVYGMGSLFTSIMPSLVFDKVALAIASCSAPKVLLLNGTYDRETFGLHAVDFVISIVQGLTSVYESAPTPQVVQKYVTHLVYPKGTEILLDVTHMQALGVLCVELPSQLDSSGRVIFETSALCAFLASLLPVYTTSSL